MHGSTKLKKKMLNVEYKNFIKIHKQCMSLGFHGVTDKTEALQGMTTFRLEAGSSSEILVTNCKLTRHYIPGDFSLGTRYINQ